MIMKQCSKKILLPQHKKIFFFKRSQPIIVLFCHFRVNYVCKGQASPVSKSRKLDTKTKAQSTVKHAWKKKLLTHFVFFKTELNLGQICG